MQCIHTVSVDALVEPECKQVGAACTQAEVACIQVGAACTQLEVESLGEVEPLGGAVHKQAEVVSRVLARSW